MVKSVEFNICEILNCIFYKKDGTCQNRTVTKIYNDHLMNVNNIVFCKPSFYDFMNRDVYTSTTHESIFHGCENYKKGNIIYNLLSLSIIKTPLYGPTGFAFNKNSL